MGYWKKSNKYKNVKVVSGNEVYDSKAEARRGFELELLQAAGKIEKLQRQVKFVLIPAQYEAASGVYTRGKLKGQPKRGKLLEKECSYYADFCYRASDGTLVVEDVKGYKGGGAYEVFKIKRKLMLQLYGIKIKEV